MNAKESIVFMFKNKIQSLGEGGTLSSNLRYIALNMNGTEKEVHD